MVISFDGANNRTVLSLFIDDDAIADAQIFLTGNKVAILDAADFVL